MSTLIAEAVYVIARTLSKRELIRLYNMLNDELLIERKPLKTFKKRLITDEEATLFIYKTVFCKQYSATENNAELKQ